MGQPKTLVPLSLLMTADIINVPNFQVQPLFKKFNIDSEVIITERANHARDYLQDCNLEGIDGVICIGGDGMFAEIFNGILRYGNTGCGVFQVLWNKIHFIFA